MTSYECSNRSKCSLIVAVNNEDVLENCLLKSPDIHAFCQIIPKRDFPSAGEAYNAGISNAMHEILIFSHQDVYLPPGWLTSLQSAIDRLDGIDPHWGVVGVFGIAKAGGTAGYIYSTGLKKILGEPSTCVIEAQSLDEMLLVTRRSRDLFFDEKLPGFHLYGTDICLEAKRRGMKNYIISAFCIHNSNGIQFLPGAFWRSYFFLRSKWWCELPVTTPCTVITKSALPVVKYVLTMGRAVLSFPDQGRRCADPQLLYENLGVHREGPQLRG